MADSLPELIPPGIANPDISAAVRSRSNANLNQALRGLRSAGNDPVKLRQKAEEFEAFFLSQVLEQMFAGIDTFGPFGGGAGEEVFRTLINAEYGKILAKRGGLGIADQVYDELLRLAETEGTPADSPSRVSESYRRAGSLANGRSSGR